MFISVYGFTGSSHAWVTQGRDMRAERKPADLMGVWKHNMQKEPERKESMAT